MNRLILILTLIFAFTTLPSHAAVKKQAQKQNEKWAKKKSLTKAKKMAKWKKPAVKKIAKAPAKQWQNEVQRKALARKQVENARRIAAARKAKEAAQDKKMGLVSIYDKIESQPLPPKREKITISEAGVEREVSSDEGGRARNETFISDDSYGGDDFGDDFTTAATPADESSSFDDQPFDN